MSEQTHTINRRCIITVPDPLYRRTGQLIDIIRRESIDFNLVSRTITATLPDRRSKSLQDALAELAESTPAEITWVPDIPRGGDSR